MIRSAPAPHRQTRYLWPLVVAAAVVGSLGWPALAQDSLGPPSPTTTEPPPAQDQASAPKQGFSFNPDAGVVYQSGDFRVTAWGFAERAIDFSGPDYFRRVRQGAEIDLPRLSDSVRPAIVYEVDLTNTNFFGDFGGRGGNLGRRNFENMFVALQDPDDPGKFRLLIGENTHILSRDDNLSSGNLPTINRSLILEEHGSVNSFGTQFGVQFQKALSDKLTIQLGAQDNRGSLNAADARYEIGNSLSGKVILVPLNAEGRKLTIGAAVDHTRDFRDREAEGIYSRFSASHSDVGGGYAMAQVSLFDAPGSGDLDLFVRYDVVSLGIDGIDGRATQQALRTGINYNLPHTNKLASLHVEYAHNTLHGPAAIVTDRNPGDEFRIVLRASLQRYARH